MTDGNVTLSIPSAYVHPNSGVTAGTYNNVTVNAQGHVTAGSNKSYLPLSGGTMTGNLEIAPSGTEGGEIRLRNGTDAANGVILDTTGNNFRIFGTPNVGSVFVYNPQTAQLSVGGTVYAGAFQVSSDLRLKSNLEKIDSALNKVSQLSAYTYDKQGIEGRQVGVIAQDVEKVLPEAVGENDEGYKTVDYSALTALLINAINELGDEIHDR